MTIKQFAALPYRETDREIRILLITTRRKRRWSVPKGSAMAEKPPHRTAAIEAFEEAGLIGKISDRSIGRYNVRSGKRKASCEVDVFPLKVKEQVKRWPERGQRNAIWISASEAADLVHNPKLSRLIERFAALCRRDNPHS